MGDVVRKVRAEPRRFGHLGFGELLEPRVRAVTAERLGVPAIWLRPDVSFDQDLAATPEDLARLVVDLEAALAVTIPGAQIDRLRTYGDLVDAVVESRMATGRPVPPSVLVRAEITPRGRGRATLSRAVWLSPYALETIAADARRAGAGARLDVVVPASAPWAVVPRVEACFAPLAHAGVTVSVRHADLQRARAVA